jgi:DNA-directed RNA polymerase subunit RPC12/RpoP
MSVHVYGWCQWGAILSTGLLVSLMKFQSEYVCDECEQGITVRTVTGTDGKPYYRAQCPHCGGTTFVSKWFLERQRGDWYRITMFLPPHLRALVDEHWKKPDAPKLPFEEAVSDLYDV